MGSSEDCDRGKLHLDTKRGRGGEARPPLGVHQIPSMTHLCTPPQNVKVLRSESFSALMGLISPRDFVDVVMAERSDDISFTCGMSCQRSYAVSDILPIPQTSKIKCVSLFRKGSGLSSPRGSCIRAWYELP